MLRPLQYKNPLERESRDAFNSNIHSNINLLSSTQSLNSNPSNQRNGDEPLSISFLHKPRRSDSLLEKQKENEILKTNKSENSKQYENSNSTKIHQNANSDLNYFDKSKLEKENVESDVESENDETHQLPFLLRKKSGELVKSSLKFSKSAPDLTDRPAKSLPTTPTYKRQVHFGGDDSVDIRYFKQKDRPTAISASNSPSLYASNKPFNWNNDDECYDDASDMESIDSEIDLNIVKFNKQFKNKNWDLQLPNFSSDTIDDKLRQNYNVFLERMFISPDKKYIIGHVAVKNLHFEKNVIARYTLDNWESVIEIPAVYVPDIPRLLKKNGYDRFVFKISLSNIINNFQLNYFNNNFIRSDPNVKKFNICIKYYTLNNEYWDNNKFRNYEVKLVNYRKSSGQHKANINTNRFQNDRGKYSSKYLERRSSLDSDYTITDNSTFDGDFTDMNPRINLNLLNSPMSNYKFPSSDLLPFDKVNSISNLTKKDSKSDVSNFFFHSPLSSIDNSTSTEVDEDPISSLSSSNANSNISPTRDFAKLANNKTLHSNSSSVTESKSYQELLDTYCFFKKPSTVSSILDVKNNI